MKHLLTVEAAAELLSVHTRTVRRYIKENRLAARKVGGQWRIDAEDLRNFMGIESYEEIANREVANPENRSYTHEDRRKVTVSAVVDVAVASKEEALRLSSTIMAAMNGRDRTVPARCDYLFNEEEGTARFMLWGNAQFVSTMISMFGAITENEGHE